MSNFLWSLPLPLLTDSYKASHDYLYPESKKLVCYGEFRRSFDGDETDTRMIFYGIRYIVEKYISRRWTLEDLELAKRFFSTHNSNYQPFPFPEELFRKFIIENDGYFPVKIEALPEGTVIFPHVPVYQVTAENEYSGLCTYLETILTMCWYPSTVATLSKRIKDLIEMAFHESVDTEAFFLLESRLHDFGFRGCTSVEQAIIGGSAHLLNFTGSDTMPAAYYVQYELNNGNPVAQSIPAAEHSVVMSHVSEFEAMRKMMEVYGSETYAFVMDSYDYVNALERVLPALARYKLDRGGMLILRPDSGEPVDVVLKALRAGDAVFGSDINRKGYRVLRKCAVIQGDGVTYQKVQDIMKTCLEAGFSAQNVAFGMGSGLLQRLHRDTMSFATKLSCVETNNGDLRHVMKTPKTEKSKFSLPGEFEVYRNSEGVPVVYPKSPFPTGYECVKFSENLLRPVYDKRPLESSIWDNFQEIQHRISTEWSSLPPKAEILSDCLKEKIRKVAEFNVSLASLDYRN